MRRSRRRALAVAPLALLAALALIVAGCGSEEEKRTGLEGEFITVDKAVYQVQITRRLNPDENPDRAYLRGQQPAGPGEEDIAVFLKIDNEGSQDYLPPRNMKVVDTLGNEYQPLPTDSVFALDFTEPIAPNGQAPAPDSPAASGPQAGAMVLFRVKIASATNNLPLVLRIPAAEGPEAEIQLDV